MEAGYEVDEGKKSATCLALQDRAGLYGNTGRALRRVKRKDFHAWVTPRVTALVTLFALHASLSSSASVSYYLLPLANMKLAVVTAILSLSVIANAASIAINDDAMKFFDGGIGSDAGFSLDLNERRLILLHPDRQPVWMTEHEKVSHHLPSCLHNIRIHSRYGHISL